MADAAALRAAVDQLAAPGPRARASTSSSGAEARGLPARAGARAGARRRVRARPQAGQAAARHGQRRVRARVRHRLARAALRRGRPRRPGARPRRPARHGRARPGRCASSSSSSADGGRLRVPHRARVPRRPRGSTGYDVRLAHHYDGEMPTTRRTRRCGAPRRSGARRRPEHLPRWWPKVQRVETVRRAIHARVRHVEGPPVRATTAVTASEPPRARRWGRSSRSPFERFVARSHGRRRRARDGGTRSR
jgi:hypothetical protein